MQKILKENGLSIVWLGLFFATFIVGQSLTGFYDHNREEREEGRPEITYVEYLESPHFLEATMENWESEFLQMFCFVMFTVFLYQKGSAESKKLDEAEPVDRDPREAAGDPEAPWPVRHGGWVLSVYENSLGLALFALFSICFFLHAVGGAGAYNEERASRGMMEQISTVEYMTTARFWFESFQNWQSEFLAVGAMVVLTIWLRQRGSPESKPVDAPHSQTGSE